MKTWVFNEAMLDEAIQADLTESTQMGGGLRPEPEYDARVIRAFLHSRHARPLRWESSDPEPPSAPATVIAVAKAA